MIIISSFAILFCLSVGYSAFSTNINLTVKGNFKEKTAYQLLKNKAVTSGKDMYGDNRYVYRGPNLDSYIKLDDDLYRIISAESDGNTRYPIAGMPIDLDKALDISKVLVR